MLWVSFSTKEALSVVGLAFVQGLPDFLEVWITPKVCTSHQGPGKQGCGWLIVFLFFYTLAFACFYCFFLRHLLSWSEHETRRDDKMIEKTLKIVTI